MRPRRSRDRAWGTILWREFGASAYDLGSFSVLRNYASDVLVPWRLTFWPRPVMVTAMWLRCLSFSRSVTATPTPVLSTMSSVVGLASRPSEITGVVKGG